MATDTSVMNMLIDSINGALLSSCRTLLDASDVTKAGLVKPGLLQDDPLKFGITVLTLANDPYHPGTWHHQLAKEGPGNSGMVPSLETGGPDELWFRRFTTLIQMYWPPTMNQQTSRQNANVVLSRCEKTIIDTQPVNMFDTFGEGALEIFLAMSEISDAGGPGQYIHHAKIHWQCMTLKN